MPELIIDTDSVDEDDQYILTPDSKGRITIPAEVRRDMSIDDDEELQLTVVDGQFVVSSHDSDAESIINDIEQVKSRVKTRLSRIRHQEGTPEGITVEEAQSEQEKSPMTTHPQAHRHIENVEEGATSDDGGDE